MKLMNECYNDNHLRPKSNYISLES